MGWSSDKCTGGTAGASSSLGGSYLASYAFDNNLDNVWASSGGAPQYIGYDFGSGNAHAIRKIRAMMGDEYGDFYINCMWDDFEVRASNVALGDSGYTTLHSVTDAGDWTSDVWREWEFSNDTAYRYVWIHITQNRGGSYVMAGEIEMLVYEAIEAEITDNAGMGDSLDFFSLADTIEDNAGMGDSVDIVRLADEITDDAGMGDDIEAVRAHTENVFGTVLMGDSVEIIKSVVGPITDNAGMGDAIEFFNYSEWLRNNLDQAVTLYFFTLTGAADGKSDVEIPIVSFQARKRQGEPTYLAVTIRGQDYAGQINDRPNGEMVVDMAYRVGDTVNFRQEILRVDLEDIRIDEGGRNYSVTLTGHRTETWANKIATLEHPTYRSLSDGAYTLRFSKPDPFLNPGDTLKVGADQYLVEYIVYNITDNYQVMEIYEAS